jgi:hypothetical protein
MRKITIFLLLAFFIAGTVFAQPIREQRREVNPPPANEQRHGFNPQQRNNPQHAASPVTLDGTLKLERGLVAVETGDAVYFVPLLNQYIGFINGLKEGTRISIEGFSRGNFVRPTRISIEDRSYNFPAQRMGPAPANHDNNRRWDNSGKNRGNQRHPRHHSQNQRNRQCNCCR